MNVAVAEVCRQRTLLRSALDIAIHSALPEHYLLETGLIERIAALPRSMRCHIVGIGKGAGAMAAALENAWPRPDLPGGLVVTRDGYGQATWSVSMLQAGHPMPDHRSALAADYLLAYLDRLDQQDFVAVLISGGGSALLSKPVPGVSIDALAKLTAQMMAQGVPIHELNIVRKHLTTTLGGKLARAAFPAQVDAIILSDVAGDDPAIVASGPFHPDPSSLADALAIIRKAGVIVDRSITDALENDANETPTAGDPAFRAVKSTIIPSDCWIAPVSTMLSEAGYEVEVIDRLADDDARVLAIRHAQEALVRRSSGQRLALLSGGEATVQLRGDGIGGPNAEYALQLAVELKGADGIWAIACDTDGTDGPTSAAGAIISPNTLSRAEEVGVSANRALDTSDSGTFFKELGDAVVTGPTLTNINDMRIILIDASESDDWR
jgi:glycerate 2-kinase